jgi:hypothetical protein
MGGIEPVRRCHNSLPEVSRFKCRRSLRVKSVADIYRRSEEAAGKDHGIDWVPVNAADHRVNHFIKQRECTSIARNPARLATEHGHRHNARGAHDRATVTGRGKCNSLLWASAFRALVARLTTATNLFWQLFTMLSSRFEFLSEGIPRWLLPR